MPLIPSFVNRSADAAAGDEIKTLTDGDGRKIQAMALVGESAEQLGGATNPVQVAGLVLDAIQSAIEALGTLAYVVSGTVSVDTLPSVELDEYGTNDIEEASATITYIGKEKADGTWLVLRIDSGTSFRYASAANNAGVSNYATAWAGRAALVYGSYGEAF